MSSTVSILLPSKRDTQLISRLRSTTVYPTFRARTNRFKNSFIPYCLCNYQRQSWHFILLFIVCLCVCLYLCNCFNPVFGWQNTINVQNFTLIGCLASEKFLRTHKQQERYWPGGSVHMACQHGSAPNWVQWGAQPLQRPQQHWNRVTTKGTFHQSRFNLIWIRIRGHPIWSTNFCFTNADQIK